jgi:hypothetical protein
MEYKLNHIPHTSLPGVTSHKIPDNERFYLYVKIIQLYTWISVKVMVFKPLSQYFSYIVAVSFIVGGYRRKLQT